MQWRRTLGGAGGAVRSRSEQGERCHGVPPSAREHERGGAVFVGSLHLLGIALVLLALLLVFVVVIGVLVAVVAVGAIVVVAIGVIVVVDAVVVAAVVAAGAKIFVCCRCVVFVVVSVVFYIGVDVVPDYLYTERAAMASQSLRTPYSSQELGHKRDKRQKNTTNTPPRKAEIPRRQKCGVNVNPLETPRRSNIAVSLAQPKLNVWNHNTIPFGVNKKRMEPQG